MPELSQPMNVMEQEATEEEIYIERVSSEILPESRFSWDEKFFVLLVTCGCFLIMGGNWLYANVIVAQCYYHDVILNGICENTMALE